MYLSRHLNQYLQRVLNTMPVVVLTGMRQVGKTTMLKNDPVFNGRRYLNLDDYSTLAAARSYPQGLFDADERVTIDEIQRAPELLPYIKSLVDDKRVPGQFVLSGSANLLLLSKVSESLAGRAAYVNLWPMSMRELKQVADGPVICSLMGGRLPDLSEGIVPSGISITDLLQGGMPQVAVHAADQAIWFSGFVQSFLERDIRGLSQIADLPDFQRFMRLVSLRTATVLTLSEVARDAQISATTARRYLGLLEASCSVFRLQPYLRSRSSRLIKSPKVYFADSGLAAHLSGRYNANLPPDDPFIGSLLETYIASNLKAVLSFCAPQAQLYYWNVQGRYEVDFVIENGDSVIAIEIKRGSRWSAKDLKGLKQFLKLTPSCKLGILACSVDKPVRLADNLIAMPLSQLIQ